MKFLTKITEWYFTRGAVPYWVIFIIDILVVFLSAVIVHAFNNGTLYTLSKFGEFCGTTSIYLVIYALCFHKFHTYVGVVRYSSFIDLQRIALAVFTAFWISIAFKYIFANEHLFPITAYDLVTCSVLSLFIMMMIRILVKYWFDSIYNVHEVTNIYIYGVKEGGIALAKSIRSQKPTKYRVKGFVTDDADFSTFYLMGVKVVLSEDNLTEHMKVDNATAIFISPLASEALRNNNAMVNELLHNDIKIFMMPSEQEWDIKTKIDHKELHEVEIEDLLPRDTITVDLEAVESTLQSKRILITGAAGSIGSELASQIASFKPKTLVLIDQAETPLHSLRLKMEKDFPDTQLHFVLGDITNRKKMHDIFEEQRPEYVFHAAAYKHVPMMEDNPSESIHNNVVGTRIIADLATQYGTDKFVMISTDKAVNPTNVMGCSKRICELYVQSLDKAIKEGKVEGHTQFVTTRFGNVLGSNGSVIPLFREQIKNGGPVTVTHPDIIRYFMLISEACRLVLEAGAMGNGGEIFVFDMGQPVKIADLAKRMIKLSGKEIEITYTGLRKGEKIYEELLNDQETTLPTFHPKIKIAKVREHDYADVLNHIEVMELLNFSDDAMSVVRRMKDLVPEYKSQHSEFEVLDEVAADA